MQPISHNEMTLVNGGATIRVVPGNVTIIPVVQANVSVLQKGITQINWLQIGH